MVERRMFRRSRVRIPFYFFYYLFSFTRKEKSYERKNDTQKKLAKAPGNTRCDGDGIYSIRNGESHTKSTVTYSGGGGSKRRGFDRKLKELYGDEADKKVIEALAVEKSQTVYINASYLDGPCDLALEENSSKPVLWYDEYSKRFFTASLEQVLMAEYHLNRNYILRGEAVINELYEFLGLEPTDWGAEAGWAPMDEGMFWIEFNHIPAKLDDGSVFYIIEMPFEPILNYDEYY